jgi:hypothetical protein
MSVIGSHTENGSLRMVERVDEHGYGSGRRVMVVGRSYAPLIGLVRLIGLRLRLIGLIGLTGSSVSVSESLSLP